MHLIATLHQSLIETKTQKSDVGTDVTTVLRVALGEKLRTPKFSRICVQVQKEDQKKKRITPDLVAQCTKIFISHSVHRTTWYLIQGCVMPSQS